MNILDVIQERSDQYETAISEHETNRQLSLRGVLTPFNSLPIQPKYGTIICYYCMQSSHNNIAIMHFDIPREPLEIVQLLQSQGHEAYLVGGCVRDLLMNRAPKDWDIVTSATPDEMLSIGQNADIRVVYENNFGTVSFIFPDNTPESGLREIQATPYRSEGIYSDKRHPDSVSFSKNVLDDVKRRDFTINALIYDTVKHELHDNTGGISDIISKVIRTIGSPFDRFSEDPLRIMRAVRFSAQLGFTIEKETEYAIKQQLDDFKSVSGERIREEFIKLIMSPEPKRGLEYCRETGILDIILPELLEGYGCEQSRGHIFDVYTHNINACQNAVWQDWPLHICLSALFHDIGKPRSRRWDDEQGLYTFYGHEVIGAKMVQKIMDRMKFSREMTDKVVKLVRYHMFFSDTDTITLSAVRRMINNVGQDLIWDLMKVRRSDRIGMGKKDAEPYRLRKYESMIEEALRDPLSVGMLKIDGNMLISEFHMKPGPRMGWILNALLEEVLDDPSLNTKEYLGSRVMSLMELDDESLKTLGESGKREKEEREAEAIQQLRTKHKVK